MEIYVNQKLDFYHVAPFVLFLFVTRRATLNRHTHTHHQHNSLNESLHES